MAHYPGLEVSILISTEGRRQDHVASEELTRLMIIKLNKGSVWMFATREEKTDYWLDHHASNQHGGGDAAISPPPTTTVMMTRADDMKLQQHQDKGEEKHTTCCPFFCKLRLGWRAGGGGEEDSVAMQQLFRHHTRVTDTILPTSHPEEALPWPSHAPAGYHVGRSGWNRACLAADDDGAGKHNDNAGR